MVSVDVKQYLKKKKNAKHSNQQSALCPPTVSLNTCKWFSVPFSFPMKQCNTWLPETFFYIFICTPGFLKLFKKIFIRKFPERLISWWALSASKWQVYSTILCFWAGSLRSSCKQLSEWVQPYTARFWIPTKVVYLQHCLVVTWLVPHKTAAISAHILCTLYNHAPVYSINLFKQVEANTVRRNSCT